MLVFRIMFPHTKSRNVASANASENSSSKQFSNACRESKTNLGFIFKGVGDTLEKIAFFTSRTKFLFSLSKGRICNKEFENFHDEKLFKTLTELLKAMELNECSPIIKNATK